MSKHKVEISQAEKAKIQNKINMLANAIWEDDYEQFISLLERGADFNGAAEGGYRYVDEDIAMSNPYIVFLACCQGKRYIKELVERGIDINIPQTIYIQNAGCYAVPAIYFCAKYANKKDVFEFLIKKGAKIDATKHDGQNCLMDLLLDKKGNTVVKILNKFGLLNRQDDNGKTPLHYAAAKEDAVNKVREIIKCGPKLYIEDNKGRIPKDVAINKGNTDIKQIIGREEKKRGRVPLKVFTDFCEEIGFPRDLVNIIRSYVLSDTAKLIVSSLRMEREEDNKHTRKLLKNDSHVDGVAKWRCL